MYLIHKLLFAMQIQLFLPGTGTNALGIVRAAVFDANDTSNIYTYVVSPGCRLTYDCIAFVE